MSICIGIRPLIHLGFSGELTPEQSKAVGEHIARCPACESEHAQYSMLISAGKSMYAKEYRLADPVRRRIAREAAGKAARGSWGLPLFELPARPAWVASAAAIVALAALTAGFWMKGLPTPSGRQEEISKLEVVADRGVVRLAWSDGEKASYTVYKTIDPRLARGEAHVVRGNVWVDTHPESSPVVFYRIE